LRSFPSKWRAVVANQDPVQTVKIVDHFIIERTDDKNEHGGADSNELVDQ